MYAQFGFGLHKADRNRGAFATFATEGTGFSDYFPGILPHLLTLGKLPYSVETAANNQTQTSKSHSIET